MKAVCSHPLLCLEHDGSMRIHDDNTFPNTAMGVSISPLYSLSLPTLLFLPFINFPSLWHSIWRPWILSRFFFPYIHVSSVLSWLFFCFFFSFSPGITLLFTPDLRPVFINLFISYIFAL